MNQPESKTARLTDSVVNNIRKKRAQSDKDGRPKFTHKQLAEEFGTTAGAISQIVRNRTYVDPDYTPVHDGHRDTGKRAEKAETEQA